MHRNKDMRARGGIVRQSFAQTVKASGNLLARVERERLGADIDLDAGNYAGIDQTVNERPAFAIALMDCLVIENCSTDTGTQPRYSDKWFPPCAPHLDRLGDA